MKRLFLTSAIGESGVAKSIRTKISSPGLLKTAFITTPIEVEDMSDDGWYQADRRALRDNGFDFFDYTITDKSETDILHDLSGIEAMYVSGGNEFYLKQQANKNNFGKFVKEFVDSGRPYIGTSCGSQIMAKDMSPVLNMGDLDVLSQPVDTIGFSLVDFTIIPHWGSDEFRAKRLSKKSLDQMYNTDSPLVALNNFQYVEVLDDQFRIIDVRNEK